MNNISNIKLYFMFKSNKQFSDDCKYLNSDLFYKSNFRIQEKSIKKVLNNLCKILENRFNIQDQINTPNVVIMDLKENFGYYSYEENTIYLDKNSLKIHNIMHEFRHFIQAQFEEKSRIENVKVPLPDPFYRLQSSERNAYNFQHMFNFNMKDLVYNTSALIVNAARTFSLGLLHKKYFNIARKYFKVFNHICDIENIKNVENLKYKNVVRKDFKINFNNKIYNVTLNQEKDNKYFNIKNNDKDFDFAIINNKCTVFPLFADKKYYALFYKEAIDIAINFCKVYDIKEIEMCPINSTVNVKKFNAILSDVKASYMPTNNDKENNKLFNIPPKTDISNELKKNLIMVEKEIIKRQTLDQILLENEKLVQLDRTNTIYIAGYDSKVKDDFYNNFKDNIQKLIYFNNISVTRTEDIVNVDFGLINKFLSESLNGNNFKENYNIFSDKIFKKFGIKIDKERIDEILKIEEKYLPEDINKLPFTEAFIKCYTLSKKDNFNILEKENYEKISNSMLMNIVQNGTSKNNNLFVFNLNKKDLDYTLNNFSYLFDMYVDKAKENFNKLTRDKITFQFKEEDIDMIIKYNKNKIKNEKDFENFKNNVLKMEKYKLLIGFPKKSIEIDIDKLDRIIIDKENIKR